MATVLELRIAHRETHDLPAFRWQAIPYGFRHTANLAAVVGIPPSDKANRHHEPGGAHPVRCATMQRPRVADQHVTKRQSDGFHPNVAGLDRRLCARTRPVMGAWSNLNRTVLWSDRNEAEADDQRKWGQHHVWRLAEEGPRVVHVGALILGAEQGHVTAPLIGNDALIHRRADDSEDVRIGEEPRREPWLLEGHREEVAVRTAV